jgi:hypothetical protein
LCIGNIAAIFSSENIREKIYCCTVKIVLAVKKSSAATPKGKQVAYK